MLPIVHIEMLTQAIEAERNARFARSAGASGWRRLRLRSRRSPAHRPARAPVLTLERTT